MTSKERAHLRGLAMKIEPIFQIGKSAVTPELTKSIDEALGARELIKIHVLKNCLEQPEELADILSGRTRSEVVQVIGRKIVLFRKNTSPEKKSILEQKKGRDGQDRGNSKKRRGAI